MSEWYYTDGEQPYGGYSEEEIKKLIEDGEVRKETYVCREDFHDWIIISDTELIRFFDNSANESRSSSGLINAEHVGKVVNKVNEAAKIFVDNTKSSIDKLPSKTKVKIFKLGGLASGLLLAIWIYSGSGIPSMSDADYRDPQKFAEYAVKVIFNRDKTAWLHNHI